MPEGEFLLINNNNTRTKFALADREALLANTSVMSKDLTDDGITAVLEDWDYENVVLASVVPSSLSVLMASQKGRKTVQVNHEIELGIDIDFPDPSTVGADRLANAAAVAEPDRVGGVVVVDFGTAVTFDIVDSRPAYIGGVIAPGLDAMRHYLHQKTALLPEIDLERPESAVGRSTIHAMQSGAFHGYRGLTREILARVIEEMDCPAKVIATGGYAALIADGLPEIQFVEPSLTMQGLLRIAKLNFSS